MLARTWTVWRLKASPEKAEVQITVGNHDKTRFLQGPNAHNFPKIRMYPLPWYLKSPSRTLWRAA